MTHLRILTCGPAMTVQDTGRIGAQRYGISGSGAMDYEAYRFANALVMAAEDAAVLEFAVFGGRFSVDEPTLLSVTGGNCQIDVDGVPHAPWTSFPMRPGSVLSIGPLSDAVYGYIGIGGGIDVPPFMGSRSTHSRSNVGGYEGRALKPGDRLGLFPGIGDLRGRRLNQLPKRPSTPIRVVAGPQDDYFDAAAWTLFLSEQFNITTQRDRMGMILDGPKLDHSKGFNIVSDAIAFGSIQVPGSGRPIVLLADRQSTGGYPKIATVASCDLGRLVQTMSGQNFQFEKISADEAEELVIAAHSRVERSIREIEIVSTVPDLSSSRLLELNLIGGVENATENNSDSEKEVG